MCKNYIYTMKKPQDTRVPIPLTAEENQKLQQFADDEYRSKQSMAGIIYRLGMKTYLNSKELNHQSQ